MASEELLEKLIAGLSSDIHQKRRVYKNDFIRVLNKVKELNFSTKKQGLLLISCCAELLPDETPSCRMDLIEQVWIALKPHTEFGVEHYNELLRVYIANNRTLNVSSFIQQMGKVKPNTLTYELILEALGEVGDLNQATEVIANMKAAGLPATEEIFNSLIMCQGKSGNLANIKEVLKQDLVLKEMQKAQQNGLQFSEIHIMKIVKMLASVGLYEAIPKVLKFLPEDILKTPSISPYMQSVSTSLVFQNHPVAALEIYKCLPLPSFGPKDDQGLHGRSLVRDCVKASIGSGVISLIAEELMSSGRNPIALQNACEAALQLGKVPLALDLFTRMKQMGMPVRPHYFWPILLHTSKTYGEKGIMNTMSTMVKMDVKPDYETIMTYTLPYVSFTSPQNLMKKFQDTGLSVSTSTVPMMETLLNTGQVRAASEICELFEGKVDTDVLLRSVVKGYLISLDVKSTIHILEDVTAKAMDKNKDWVGRFLCVFMRHKKVKEDLSDFMAIVQALKETSLKISTSAADYCISRLPEIYDQQTTENFRNNLIDITDERLIDESDIFVQQMLHPDGLALWTKMQEADVTPSQKFIRNLCSLCTANNKDIPAALAVLLDKETRQAIP
ncbi:Leucine-rich PPR motif-containing protein, mitochondrial [Papilio machaon]|uniref:Leucine-rich PPR motif-containing protein, mitochondrial n=1 Tax=Papilio machaon TaxID=76193 RepID=A0A0N1I954_PAPMA|nr:Leucine-rich PPR motif-containing protein, mitochondrial [Papilio machaon]